MDERVYVGRAGPDAAGNAGWLLGHFMPPGDVRHSADVEIKWGVHPVGDRRAAWVRGEQREALLVLIKRWLPGGAARPDCGAARPR